MSRNHKLNYSLFPINFIPTKTEKEKKTEEEADQTITVSPSLSRQVPATNTLQFTRKMNCVPF